MLVLVLVLNGPTKSGTSSSTCRQYESEPEPHLNGRRIYHARGKLPGGSSSINGMIFQRATKAPDVQGS